MAVSNVVLLSSTEGEMSVTGLAVRGAAFGQNATGSYSAAIHVVDLEGRVVIEGSLVTQPGAEDWTPITFAPASTRYVQFPYAGPSQTVDGRQVVTFAFKGNFTWIRARLVRDYLGLPDNADPDDYGHVHQIVLSAVDGSLSSTTPVISNAVSTISSAYLGNGAHILASIVGTSALTLNFKALTVGSGMALTENATTISFSSLSAATTFTGLADTANAITSNAVLIGSADAVAFTNAATTANTALTWNGATFVWRDVSTFGSTVAVRDEGNTVVSAASAINFVGPGVAVSGSGGTATVTIDQTPDAEEWVEFRYTGGGAGNLNAGDVLLGKTAGVAVEIVDAVNCIVRFTFTGRPYPPTSIALMGQTVQTNEFSYQNVSPAIGTRKIAGGGTATAPTLLGSFTGPITLQLRMADTGASASAGQRARMIVMFKF